MTIRLNDKDKDKLNHYQRVLYDEVVAIFVTEVNLPLDYENSSIVLLNDEKGYTLELYLVFSINECTIYLILEETNYIFYMCRWHANDYYDDDGAYLKHDEIPKIIELFINGDAKILEYKCNGKPYKWKLCIYRNGKWLCGQTTADTLLPQIGIRTKEEYYLKKIDGRKYVGSKRKKVLRAGRETNDSFSD